MPSVAVSFSFCFGLYGSDLASSSFGPASSKRSIGICATTAYPGPDPAGEPEGDLVGATMGLGAASILKELLLLRVLECPLTSLMAPDAAGGTGVSFLDSASHWDRYLDVHDCLWA